MRRLIVIAVILTVLLVTVVISLVLFSREEAIQEAEKQELKPEWYNKQDNPDYLFVYGVASRSNKEMSQQAAFAGASAEAAFYVGSFVEKVLSEIAGESAANNDTLRDELNKISETAANAEFSGMTIDKRRTYMFDDGNYQTFVRLKIPKHEINRAVIKQVSKNKPLLNKVESSSGYQELLKNSSEE